MDLSGGGAIATIVGIAIAAYGAGLATFKFQLERKQAKPQLNVTCEYVGAPRGLPMPPVIAGGGDFDHLAIFILNRGVLPATVAVGGLVTKEKLAQLHAGRDYYYIPLRFNSQAVPGELPPGKRFMAIIPAQSLALSLKNQGIQGKVQLIPYCEDAVRRRYSGRSITVDINRWISPSPATTG